MQVSATSTPPTTSASLSEPTSADAMTSDLFAYCEAQMSSIDTQAEAYFSSAQQNNGTQQQITKISSQIGVFQSEMEGNSTATDPNVPAVGQEIQALESQPGLSQADVAALQSAYKDVMNGNDDKISATEAQNAIDSLTAVSQNLGSDNQMAMISLQSAMSTREQVIQMTTNILQVVNDSASKVLANIHS
jgi:hypothetical protein